MPRNCFKIDSLNPHPVCREGDQHNRLPCLTQSRKQDAFSCSTLAPHYAPDKTKSVRTDRELSISKPTNPLSTMVVYPHLAKGHSKHKSKRHTPRWFIPPQLPAVHPRYTAGAGRPTAPRQYSRCVFCLPAILAPEDPKRFTFHCCYCCCALRIDADHASDGAANERRVLHTKRSQPAALQQLINT